MYSWQVWGKENTPKITLTKALQYNGNQTKNNIIP